MKESLCNVLPPKEIYDVLSNFEQLGGQLPQSVESWWYQETCINQTSETSHPCEPKTNK